jgi:transcriptional regulator with XRE-family HTH domain
MKWGDALRRIREGRQMTIRQVCERTKGITASYLSQLETGKRSIDEAILEQLLQLYGIKQTEFFEYAGGSDASLEIKSVKVIPVIDMARATFDDLWHLSDKMASPAIVKEEIGAGGIRDTRAFALEVTRPDMMDCGTESGDYLVLSPRIEPSSGEIGLVLVRDGTEILIRRVFQKDKNLIRLVSDNPAKEERIIDRREKEIKIYFIDSIQKRQKRRRRR